MSPLQVFSFVRSLGLHASVLRDGTVYVESYRELPDILWHTTGFTVSTAGLGRAYLLPAL